MNLFQWLSCSRMAAFARIASVPRANLRSSVAVEVMRHDARGERQREGENGGLRCGLRVLDKAYVNSIDSRRNREGTARAAA
jgi:hypothetical protein